MESEQAKMGLVLVIVVDDNDYFNSPNYEVPHYALFSILLLLPPS
jgi:hypothetical protein